MLTLFRAIRQELLAQNRVTRYLFYAVGEVLLVVIGIYIAVEFNNYNQGKQNRKLTEANINLLIENLRKDSIYFKQVLENITEDQELLASYQARLNKPEATLDTLIQIAKFELKPSIVSAGFNNDDAYNTMVQSGEINLFEKTIRQDIFSLYRLHSNLKNVTETHFELYLENINLFNQKYGLEGTSLFQKGPFKDAIWKNVDMKELSLEFQTLFNSKRNHYSQTKRLVERIVDDTNLSLVKLNKAKDD